MQMNEHLELSRLNEQQCLRNSRPLYCCLNYMEIKYLSRSLDTLPVFVIFAITLLKKLKTTSAVCVQVH